MQPNRLAAEFVLKELASGHDEKAPLIVEGTHTRERRRHQSRSRTVGVRQIGDDRGALGQGEIPVLQHGDLASGVQRAELRRLRLPGPRSDQMHLVVETEFVQDPVGPHRARRPRSPENQVTVLLCSGQPFAPCR